MVSDGHRLLRVNSPRRDDKRLEKTLCSKVILGAEVLFLTSPSSVTCICKYQTKEGKISTENTQCPYSGGRVCSQKEAGLVIHF